MSLSARAIFDPDRVRTDASPARHDEPTFAFYDRCANAVIGSVRDNLEAWFSRYPSGRHRRDLLGRLRVGDRRQWGSAVWELYVHEALCRFGFDVTPHPHLPATTRQVDFLAKRGGERVFVECVIVTHSDKAAVRRGGVAALEAAIDKSGILDYWFDLQFERIGPTSIPPHPFVEALRAWVAAQDIEALDAVARQSILSLPSFDWNQDGWLARVWAIPRTAELRGREDMRPLGIMAGENDEKSVWLALRAAMESKALAYGELDAPYVIAVNAPDAWPSDGEAIRAAFGAHAFTGAWEREGFLLREDGTAYPGVSGVLIGVAVQPHSFPRCWPTLYENPLAERPVPESLRWARVRVEGESPLRLVGIDPPALFGVAPDWPGVPWP